MYAFIHGIVENIGTDRAEINCGGVGYEVLTNSAALSQLKKGTEAKFYTTLIVREDALTLFGFLTREEKSMFEKLITVSGVGPKLALAVLSGMNASEIALSIVTGDDKSLSKISGIGKKTAQRLILELRNSIDNDQLTNFQGGAVFKPEEKTASDAVSVLIEMGFTPAESAAAVALIKAEGGTAEQMVMKALRTLDKTKMDTGR